MPTRQILSPVDAAWFRLDEDANTADIVALLTFEHPIDHATIREIVRSRFALFPEFTRRVVDPGAPALPHWEELPDFEIDDHIRAERLHDGTREDLQRFVSLILTRKLRRDRPLWQIWIVDNVGAGSALVVKIHHCIGDGFALVGVLLSLCDEPVAAAEIGDPPHPSLSDQLWDSAADLIRHPDHLLDAARVSGQAAGALGELVMLPFDTQTSLRGTLTGVRLAAWSHGIAFDRFRRLARASGGTINDVLMSVLAGAVRALLTEAGDDVDHAEIRALIPVNLRPIEQVGKALGNRFGLVFLDLPVAEAEQGARLSAVQASMRKLKESPQAVVAFGVLGAIGLAPDVIEHLALDLFSRKASLVVTNMPGPRERIQLAGHEVDHMMFWVPHPTRFGLGVSLLSYGGEVRIGVRADSGVIADPQLLVDAFDAEFALLEERSLEGQ